MKTAKVRRDIPEYGLKKGEVVTVTAPDERLADRDPFKTRCRSTLNGTGGYSVEFHGRKGWLSDNELN
jgi:hypothetical protein